MIGKKKYSDADIIRGCLENNRSFQELLYRKYFPVCFHMCLRYTQDRDVAKMIVHDGFLKVYQNLDKYSTSGSLKSWIKRIVFNCLSDYYRKESKYIKTFVFEEFDKEDKSSALSNLYFEDLMELLEKLTYIQKEVFKLFAIDGLAHKDIAEMLGLSEANSKWHLYQARKSLKALLAKQNKISKYG